MMAKYLLCVCLLFSCGVTYLCAFECNILGTDITTPSGFVESPPSTAAKRGCIWLFDVPAGKFLKVNFTKFELHRQHLCENSFVELTSQEFHEQRFCGDQRPPLMTFTGPQELMIYTRLASGAVPGFRAEFWTENEYEACPKEQRICGNGRCYKQSQHCDKVDDCGDGTDEENCGDGTDEENCGFGRDEPESCGKPAIPPLTVNYYIAGGRDALPGSWPWQVSLQMKGVSPSGHFCGGTLIDNYWILTAAHCFENRTAPMVRVRLGSYDTYVHQDGEFIRNVEKEISHPGYDPDTIDNDIALLKMAAPIPFTSKVSPACLPEEDETLEAGTMMFSTGWGDGKYMEKMEVLRQAMMPLISFERCNQLYYGEVNGNTLCTHYEDGGHSTCMGDSGGPLVHERGDAWKLYGIVSWGHEDCGHRSWPSVYTNVASFIPWIKQTINSQ